MLAWLFAAIIIFLATIALISAIVIVKPYEQVIWMLLGKYRKTLSTGLNFVIPLVSELIRVDLRTQVIDVPKQQVITRDNSPTDVDAIIYIRVVEPKKACFEVENYRMATVFLAQTTLRSTIGELELDEILYNRTVINTKLRDILDKATDPWGVKVESVEIREVEPIERVKRAMEEQTSAEREKRAAILKAEGERKAKILTAEGEKIARILQAEGIKQSKMLEAEGIRIAKILEGQGEAQKLRIISLGSLPLDQKALTVLSLHTLRDVASGQATKIIYPLEISKLLEGISEYIGAGRKIPERVIAEKEEVEKIVGKTDDILGKIPTQEELAKMFTKKKEDE